MSQPKSPGDYLKPGEDETNGLKARLNERLAPLGGADESDEGDWEIGDCLAQWWRPNFETFMVSILLSGASCLHTRMEVGVEKDVGE